MIRVEFIYRKHAIEMMAERGISKEQVEIALKRGNKFKQTDGILAKHTYFAVAYKIIGRKYIIKTVYVN